VCLSLYVSVAACVFVRARVLALNASTSVFVLFYPCISMYLHVCVSICVHVCVGMQCGLHVCVCVCVCGREREKVYAWLSGVCVCLFCI
jgi:hypothetical protein